MALAFIFKVEQSYNVRAILAVNCGSTFFTALAQFLSLSLKLKKLEIRSGQKHSFVWTGDLLYKHSIFYIVQLEFYLWRINLCWVCVENRDEVAMVDNQIVLPHFYVTNYIFEGVMKMYLWLDVVLFDISGQELEARLFFECKKALSNCEV